MGTESEKEQADRALDLLQAVTPVECPIDLKTPERMARSLRYLTSGYTQKVSEVVNGAIYESSVDDLVAVRGVEFYSLCEHHVLPFYGVAHVGYIPNGKIIGLSKIPRIVDVFARRLQVQERLTEQIALALVEVLGNPFGVAVVLEGRHLCMAMRGVEKQNADMTTSCMLGYFRDLPAARAEFLNLIGRAR